MPDLILFLSVFSIACGYLKISYTKRNKKLIKMGILGLFMWFAMFIWVPFAINFLRN